MYVQSLNTLKAGEKGVIVALGNDTLLRNRLISRGVMIGSQIEIICNTDLRNPVMLAIEDTRLAVEQEIARQILVFPLKQEKGEQRRVSKWLKSFCPGKCSRKKNIQRHRHRHEWRR